MPYIFTVLMARLLLMKECALMPAIICSTHTHKDLPTQNLLAEIFLRKRLPLI